MLGILSNTTYARLFSAQIVALLGTGLLTVALGLLAYDLAGPAAGAVLGTAFTIKMVAYVGLSPIAEALSSHLPRKAVLIGADLVRAGVALLLPFIDAIWQVYLLIFVLQAASATFTPAFQATIPDILPDEEDYTRALSLSRLAYDLESLVSPAMAGLLLLVMSFHGLFGGTFLGFVVSAVLVAGTALPPRSAGRKRPFRERLTRGARIYLATPRLRGLLSLNLAAAAAGAFVLVNTVVMVQAEYGLGARAVALAMAAFGGGSMLAALALPRLLGRLGDRPVMTFAAATLAAFTLLQAAVWLALGLPSWPAFLASWGLTGILYSAVLTPSGRLLRRSSHPEDRPALFAAQFALSHACWLIAYPLAGWGGAALGMAPIMGILGLVAVAAVIVGLRLWPTADPAEITHDHPELPPDHPHLRDHGATPHRHAFVVDDEHPAWPNPAA